jgi:RNA polymerase sigma-70 factor (ECF subfamily)
VQDVDDVVQESFLRIWKARSARPIDSAKAFLFQVARHLVVDQVRRERTASLIRLPDPVLESVMAEGPGVAETACTQDELDWLERAIDALPPRCREVIVLRQIKGLSQKEIATHLGLSELTVQTHVVTGLRRLRAFAAEHAMRTHQP